MYSVAYHKLSDCIIINVAVKSLVFTAVRKQKCTKSDKICHCVDGANIYHASVGLKIEYLNFSQLDIEHAWVVSQVDYRNPWHR